MMMFQAEKVVGVNNSDDVEAGGLSIEVKEGNV